MVPERFIRKLIREATKARERAYAPYSGIKVGAAVLADDGKIFSGCNIENASYGLSNCAERTAVFKAVSEGRTKLQMIAIVTEKDEESYPCGACRQVLLQFNPRMTVVMTSTTNKKRTMKLGDLLPHPFYPKQLRAS